MWAEAAFPLFGFSGAKLERAHPEQHDFNVTSGGKRYAIETTEYVLDQSEKNAERAGLALQKQALAIWEANDDLKGIDVAVDLKLHRLYPNVRETLIEKITSHATKLKDAKSTIYIGGVRVRMERRNFHFVAPWKVSCARFVSFSDESISRAIQKKKRKKYSSSATMMLVVHPGLGPVQAVPPLSSRTAGDLALSIEIFSDSSGYPFELAAIMDNRGEAILLTKDGKLRHDTFAVPEWR